MFVKDETRYLRACVGEFTAQCETGAFDNEFEAKRALWKVSVLVIIRNIGGPYG